ncbi:MAG: sugar isomerase [Verrucomicrobiales bacterium]|nr:sugar isomerase [Verrucomicrobiales bacterium]
MVQVPTPREEASWRSWGGVQTEAAVVEEIERIDHELKTLQGKAEFGLEILPVERVGSVEDAENRADQDTDVVLVYACSGSGSMLRACLKGGRDRLVFVRHQSGPIYYWYEALSVRYLRTDEVPENAGQEADLPDVHVDDVVVDEYPELLWRLRALAAVKNMLGNTVVALGGAWGKYAPDAPQVARERYGLRIVDVGYDTFEVRLREALADRARMERAERCTREYLSLPQTTLETKRPFVVNAFVLYELFKELLEEHSASVFTIKSCMGTIIPMSKTTACLSLALLNDEGPMAFCESDFVIIPAGILMRYLSNKPVFLHNSTFPHGGVVTCAHCTCPRRLDGRTYAPTRILTHYESDYGAAPKVEIPLGQAVTFLDPRYSSDRWVSFKGVVRGNPFYEICRSQQDVEIEGNWRDLLAEARDSHWIMVYGDYLREVPYACRKIGIRCTRLEAA